MKRLAVVTLLLAGAGLLLGAGTALVRQATTDELARRSPEARAFESAGIRVTPAPTGFHTLGRTTRLLAGYLPSARGLYYTSLALHEYLGLAGSGVGD